MSTYYLLNTVTIAVTAQGPTKFLAGRLIDSAQFATSAFTGAGATLWPSSDAVVAAAAAKCQSLHSVKGVNEVTLDMIMAVAAADSLNNSNQLARRQVMIPGPLLPAKAVAVHAQVAAGAPINLTSGFTLQYPKRALEVVLGGTAVSTIVTVVGTAVDGTALTVVQTCIAGTTEIGNGKQIFETITSVTSNIDPGDTFDLKTADGFGVGEAFVSGSAVLSVDGVIDASATFDPTTGGVKSSTNPNGTHAYGVKYTSVRAASLP